MLPSFVIVIMNNSNPNLKMKRLYLFILLASAVLSITAQSQAQRQRLEMKNILHELISQHKDLGYNNLWEAFATTDWHPSTQEHPDGYIWDMYSNVVNANFQAKGDTNSPTEGEIYNREHTVPQSWFNQESPMKADLFHVYPVDGKINSLRNDHPYGEVRSVTSGSNGNFSKYGPPTTECGAPVNVFEPADEYKGDLARTYFYMVVCYQDKLADWTGQVFGSAVAPDAFNPEYPGYPGMAEWAIRMFIRWSHDDPVSDKERDRNNAVYELQGNRNPFIDCPGLERFLWEDYLE